LFPPNGKIKKTTMSLERHGGWQSGVSSLFLDELTFGLIESKLKLLGVVMPHRRTGSLVEALVATE
jgi:hypothetical protein